MILFLTRQYHSSRYPATVNMDITVILSFVLCAIIAYILLTYLRNRSYWKNRGVPQVPGLIPFIGNILPMILQKKFIGDLFKDIYDEYKDYSMVGMFISTKPVLVLRDPELIKTVLITKFSNFPKNQMSINTDYDPLLAKGVFFTTGEIWAKGRKHLTYAFSSAKLKLLIDTAREASVKFDNYIKRTMKEQNKVEVEVKELFSKFTTEVVANAGFGMQANSFEDEKSALFFQMGKQIFEPSMLKGLLQSFVLFMPIMQKVLRLRFLPLHIDRFFRETTEKILEARKRESRPRNDYFQLMADFQKTEGGEIDKDMLSAQVFAFFIEGYETSSISLSFVCYELATNPDIQEKVREEVNRVLAANNGVMAYEALRDMTYMDQVISETFRLHSPATIIGKICTTPCELVGSDGLTCRIERNDEVSIPISALHLDPQYWPNPYQFDPERFSPERKSEITKFTYLPFGEGQRACVGMRMALMMIKAGVATMLHKYTIELSPKTQTPLVNNPAYFLMTAKGGIWVNIKPIKM